MSTKSLRYELNCYLDHPDLVEEVIRGIGKKPNKVQGLHMRSILGNMLRSQIAGLPVRHATKPFYTWEWRYNPLALRRRGVTTTLKLMVKAGYAIQHRGYSFGKKSKRASTFEPTQKLLEYLGGKADLERLIFVEQETLVQKVDEIKVGYNDSPASLEARRVLDRYNPFLSKYRVEHPSDVRFLISPMVLKRNFVDIEEHLGGRFYVFLQNLPQKERAKLTIDEESTVELDFKSFYPAMLWGKQGISVFKILKDPYALETEIYPDEEVQRDIVKKLFMAMLGTRLPRDAINSTIDEFPRLCLDYSVLERAVKEIRRVHVPIGHHFLTGKRFMLELQYMDSQICESILKMTMDREVLVLPVHDSFIVQAQHEDQLRAVMAQAFRNHCGGFDPVIEKKGTKKKVETPAAVEPPKVVSDAEERDQILGDLLGRSA